MSSLSRISALDLLLEVAVRLHADMESSLADLGLTPARTHLVWEVRDEPLAQAEVARRLGVTPRNVTALVDALESGGIVRRVAHPSDRRVQLVALTERGQAMADGLVRGRADLADRVFGPMGEERTEAAVSILREVRDRFADLEASGGK